MIGKVSAPGEVVRALPLLAFAVYTHLATQVFWLNAFGWDRGGARLLFLAPLPLGFLAAGARRDGREEALVERDRLELDPAPVRGDAIEARPRGAVLEHDLERVDPGKTRVDLAHRRVEPLWRGLDETAESRKRLP